MSPLIAVSKPAFDINGSGTPNGGTFAMNPDELRDLGDRFLVIGRIRSGALSSGARLDSDYADLFTLSAGRVIREQTYFNRADAVEAAGLRE
jgi:ketosteroid isomerase-like protein